MAQALSKPRQFLPAPWEPARLVRFMLSANIVMYLTALLMDPSAISWSSDPFSFLSPSVPVLYKLGASGTLPVMLEDRWWTLLTANYLHGSLIHLLFNMSALRGVGNQSIQTFGPSRLFLIYTIGGVLAMWGSSLARIPLTIGASGAVCALIGTLAYHDWRKSRGDLKRRLISVGVWVVFIAMIGLLIPNVNNWAHAIGFVTGMVFGFIFWPRGTHTEAVAFRLAASSCLVVTVGTLIYGLLFS